MFAYRWDDNDDELDSQTADIWSAAACSDGGSGGLTGLFFSDEIADIDIAKAICATCALAAPCLAGALARREPAGVWGGQLFADGQVIAFKRKRGRPPKVAATISAEPSVRFEPASETVSLADYQEGRRKSA
jgi:WhiB family redox-sensing transcriptional regulator